MWLTGRLVPNLSTVTFVTKRSCSMCLQSCLTQKGTPSRYWNAIPAEKLSWFIVCSQTGFLWAVKYYTFACPFQHPSSFGTCLYKSPHFAGKHELSPGFIFRLRLFSLSPYLRYIHQLWLNRRSHAICLFFFFSSLARASMRQHL